MGMKMSDPRGSNDFGGYQNVAKEGIKSLWGRKAGGYRFQNDAREVLHAAGDFR
jgi:hypothetical protein